MRTTTVCLFVLFVILLWGHSNAQTSDNHCPKSATNCYECTLYEGCGYCFHIHNNTLAGCRPGNENGPFDYGGVCEDSEERNDWRFPTLGNCPDPCSTNSNCRDCSKQSDCGWCHDDFNDNNEYGNGCWSRYPYFQNITSNNEGNDKKLCKDFRFGDNHYTCRNYLPCDELFFCADCVYDDVDDPNTHLKTECIWINLTPTSGKCIDRSTFQSEFINDTMTSLSESSSSSSEASISSIESNVTIITSSDFCTTFEVTLGGDGESSKALTSKEEGLVIGLTIGLFIIVVVIVVIIIIFVVMVYLFVKLRNREDTKLLLEEDEEEEMDRFK